MAEDQVSLEINPYTLPEDRHGWRGLGLPGHRKRKWYTLVQNDQVLVTALLLIPGERSVRHSHASGELSIHYDGEMRPIALWHPGGVIHGGPGVAVHGDDGPQWVEQARGLLGDEAALGAAGNAQLTAALTVLLQGQLELQQALKAAAAAPASPRIIVDVLFPPFQTTIDDPAYPDKKVITGQWYD